MDYRLFILCVFAFVELSYQRDERLTALKERTIARLARRSGKRTSLRLNGEYVGPLGAEARASVSTDEAKSLFGKDKKLNIEAALKGLLGTELAARIRSDMKRQAKVLGFGTRRKIDAGITAKRPLGAAIGVRAKAVSGTDVGLAGVGQQVRYSVETGARGPLGIGASGGFDGGFHAGIGIPVVAGGYVLSDHVPSITGDTRQDDVVVHGIRIVKF